MNFSLICGGDSAPRNFVRIAFVHMNTEDLRMAVYQSFAHMGMAPSSEALSVQFGVSQEAIERGLQELAVARHLALDASGTL